MSIFLAPFAAFFIWAGVPMFKQSPIPVIWGLAGVMGVAAFWMWVFLRRPLSVGARGLVTVGLVSGIAAVSPMLMMTGDRAVMGAVAVLTAVGVLAATWLPDNALERTAEHRDGSG